MFYEIPDSYIDTLDFYDYTKDYLKHVHLDTRM